MSSTNLVAQHYTSGKLLERLRQLMQDDDADPDAPSIETLAPYDHLHGRGIEATEELAASLKIAPDHQILDIGSGIGGPARYIANKFGCQVCGIDLTAEYCEVAQHLTRLLGLSDQVKFQQENALSAPFDDASFDGAYSMNVAMNIEDKAAFYGEIHRLLKPGGWLLLSEVSKGPGPAPTYPTPWAESADTSFLATLEETLDGLAAAGFTIVETRDTKAEAKAFAVRSRQIVDEGGKPLHRAVQLMHGDNAEQISRNMSKAGADGSVFPIEVTCKKAAS